MSLTLAAGPFGHAPAGTSNITLPRTGWLYLEPSPRRIRGFVGDQMIVDSRRPMLLFQQRRMLRHYFPLADVRTELLEPSAHTSTSEVMGLATHVDLRVGDRLIENAAWAYRDGDRVPDLRPFVAFYGRTMDRWLEEDVEVRGHARDPYHRVDAVPTSRHVRVSLDGHVLAESDHAVVIFETSLPPRWYLPPADVKAELEPSELRTACVYKGDAHYWSVQVGDQLRQNIAWAYSQPRQEVGAVRDRVCFFNEVVDIELDGEPQERPFSPWAETEWWRRTGDFEDQL